MDVGKEVVIHPNRDEMVNRVYRVEIDHESAVRDYLVDYCFENQTRLPFL